MENGKEFHNAEQQNNEADEAENFDVFIKAMVQAVEKYGRFVLPRNWIVLRRLTQPYISHFPKLSEVLE